jgi:hypothetical protein
VVVRARADQKKGGSPTLTIRVDGENSGTHRITSSALADYNYPAVTLQPGTHTIGLKGGDLTMGRNLYVDVLTFPTGGPPPDTTAPNTTITQVSPSASVIGGRDIHFNYQSSEANSTFECRVEGPQQSGAWEPCNGLYNNAPGVSYSLYPDGSYVFSVRAIAEAGNSDPTL